MPFGGPDREPARPIPRYEVAPRKRQPIALRLLAVGIVAGAALAAALSMPAERPRGAAGVERTPAPFERRKGER